MTTTVDLQTLSIDDLANLKSYLEELILLNKKHKVRKPTGVKVYKKDPSFYDFHVDITNDFNDLGKGYRDLDNLIHNLNSFIAQKIPTETIKDVYLDKLISRLHNYDNYIATFNEADKVTVDYDIACFKRRELTDIIKSLEE